MTLSFRRVCLSHLTLTALWLLTASIFAGGVATTVTATKSDGVTSATFVPQGSNIDYTIQITNTGAVTATNLSVSDPTPANTTFVAGSLHASPLALNDVYTTLANTKLYAGTTVPPGQPAATVGSGLFANDMTITDSTVFVSNTSPANGSVTVNSDGTFIYTPNANFTGTDTFTYTVKNSVDATLTDTATVTIVVNGTPVANADGPANYATPVDRAFGHNAPGVLGNDTVNGAAITSYGATTGTEQTAIGSATPTAQGGSVVLNANGSFTFTPKAGFSGNDTFKYMLTASAGSSTLVNGAGSTTATVTFYVDVLPTVTSTVPLNSATGVNIGTAITINFSEPISTFNTFTVTDTTSSTSVPFTQSPTDGNTASTFTLTPTAALVGGHVYTVTVVANQTADADGGLSMAADYVFSFTTLPPPSALNDPDTQGNRYQVTTNVAIDSALTPSPSSIFDNDTLNGASVTYGPTGPTSSTPVDGTTTITTPNGATVLLRVNGTFTYRPAPGFTGNDSFFYNLTNTSGTSRAQVLFTVGGTAIWFVDKAAATNGNGTVSSPFKDLTNITNDGAAGHPKAGDIFFIYNNASSYTGPLTLLNTQKVIGQAATGTLSALTGVTFAPFSVTLPTTGTGSNPTVANASGNGIVLASGNSINSVNFGNCSGTALAGASVGALVVSNAAINTTGAALDLTGVATPTVSVVLTGLTSSGGVKNVNLVGLNGTITLSSGALSGASGNSFDVSGAGTANISYSGTIASGSGHSVNISGKTGGTVALSGAITDTDTGINLTTNTGTTIDFSGGLNLSTGANAAFTATGGGTVTATQNNTSIVNTLTTTTGTALNIANTAIGASGLTFRSITAGTGTGSAGDGIILDTTGLAAGNGGLTVTGNGNAATHDGGTIQHKTGADGSTTSGIGIYLNSTKNVSLTNMALHDFDNFAVFGTGVAGFSMVNGTVNGTNGTSQGSPNNEGSVVFKELTGTANITNCTIANGITSDLSVINTVSASSLTLNISGSTFTGSASTTVQELLLQGGVNAGDSPSITANITTSTFTNTDARCIQAITNSAASMTINIGQNGVAGSGGTFNGMPAAMLDIDHNSTGDYSFNIQRATFNVNVSPFASVPINIFNGSQSGSSSTFQGRIVQNSITGGNNSGFDGISMVGSGPGTMTVLVDNNTVTNVAANGISYTGAQNSATNHTNLTITNNTLTMPDVNSAFGVQVSGQASSTANSVVEATITGNNVVNNPNLDYRVDSRFAGSFLQMPGYTGAATDLVAVKAFVAANNKTNGATSSSTEISASAGLSNVGHFANTPGGAAVPLPGNLQPLLFAADGVERSADLEQLSIAEGVTVSRSEANLGGIKQEENWAAQSEPKRPQFNAGGNSGVLSQSQLDSVVSFATSRWEATALTTKQASMLRRQSFEVAALADLPPGQARAERRQPAEDSPKGWQSPANLVDVELSQSSAVQSAAQAPPSHGLTGSNGLSQEQLDSVVSAAMARWEATGLTTDQVAVLHGLSFEVAALPDLHLGDANGNHIRVSNNAGGNGWFVDASAQSDAQFGSASSQTRRYTDPAGAPAGRIDLLTAIMHEMGHALGLPDTYQLLDRNSLMYGYLTKGERRLPAKGQALGVQPATNGVTHFLTQPISSLPPGKTITLKYSVTIQSNGETTISNTAQITGDNFTTVNTSDTETGPGATVTKVGIPPQINSVNNAKFKEGVAGTTFQVVATGNPAPTISTTALPANLTLSSAGLLSGTPNAGTGGTYSRTITATNGVGTDATQSFTLTIVGPPAVGTPTVTPNTGINEGASTSYTVSGTFTDPVGITEGPFTAVVDWGDSSSTSTATVDTSGSPFNYSFSGNHTYGDNGTYNVTVKVTNTDGQTGTSAARTVTVSNVAPTVNVPTTFTPTVAVHNASTPFTINGTFSDPGTSDGPFTGTVNWGDATTSAVVIAGSNYSFSGNHTYTTAGNKSVTISVKDKDNATGTSTATSVTVADKPTVTATAPSTVGATSANPGGNVTADGGSTVTARGIVYARTIDNGTPQIGGPNVTVVTDSSGGTGAFTENITGLVSNTGYSFTAYATNAAGTSYSAPLSFSTPAAIVVTNANDDSNPGSLRRAMTDVTNGGLITFDPTFFATPRTILLNGSSLPFITGKSFTITGPGAGKVTIDAQSASQIFLIADDGGLVLSDVTLANGAYGGGFSGGGAIYNIGKLTLMRCALNNNRTIQDGGAIYCRNPGTLLTVYRCTFSSNAAGVGSSAGFGGAIAMEFGAKATIANSTFVGNNCGFLDGTSSNGGGGALYIDSSIPNGHDFVNPSGASVTYSTMTGNFGGQDGGGAIDDYGVGQDGQGNYFGTLKMNNNILSGNTSAGNGNVQTSGTVVDFSTGTQYYTNVNDLVGNATGVGVFQNYGGPTNTVALLPGSNALNAGTGVTALTAAAGAGDTTLTVADASYIASTPGAYVIKIDNEQMLVTDVNLSTNVLTVQRGFNSTTAATHSSGTGINWGSDQRGSAFVGTAPDIGAYESQGYSIAVSSGTPQSTTVNAAFTNPLKAVIKDGTALLPGATVTFTAPDTGASGTFTDTTTAITTAVSDSNGIAASATFTANTTAGGPYTVGATLPTVLTPANFSLTNNPGPANHFTVSPSTNAVTAGNAVSITVTALDQFNNVATGYTGSVHFTSTDTGGSVVLPANYTFSGPDNGVHIFSNGVTLVTAGSQTVTATDAVTGTITGTTSSISVSPAAASHLAISPQPSAAATAGVAFTTQPVVMLEDPFGNVITSDSIHTVTVARGNHGTASLQGSTLTLTLLNGVATFSGLSYNVAETMNLSFSTDAGAFTVTSNDVVVSPAPASQLVITQQPSATATAGVAFATQPVVKLEDSFGNVITADSAHTITAARGNHGTASLQGSTLTLTLVNGVATFGGLSYNVAETMNLSFSTNAGVFTVTSNDVAVSPAPASQLVITQQPSATATAGVTFANQPVVKIEDPFGNVITTDSTHTITAARGSHGTASLQGSTLTLTLGNGVATFSGLSYNVAETMNLSFSTNAGVFTATSNDVVVAPAAATHLLVAAPTPVTSYVTNGGLNVTAQDQFNNTATGYSGTVHLTSTDPGFVPLSGSDLTLSSGVAGANFLLKTAGVQTITATDSVTPGINGTSNNIIVNPGPTNRFVITAPANATAGSAVGITVKATDLFGNTTPAYTGTVQFSSSDAAAILPGNSTLTSGTGNFNVTFQTVGLQNVTGTDTGTSSITSSSNDVTVADTVTITPTDATAAVTGGDTGTIRFARSGNGGTITVEFQLDAASTALASEFTLSGGGVTFNGSTGTVTIPNGSTFVDVTLTANANATGVAKPSKTVQLDVTGVTGYNIGSPSNATVTIAQNGFVVTNANDSGEGSLRQAVLNANALPTDDVITFSGPLDIVLTSGELEVANNGNLTIQGGNAVSISGNHNSRVFNVDSGANLKLVGLVIKDGTASNENGGGVFNGGTLTVLESTFSGNSAAGGPGSGDGGGIHSFGTLNVIGTTFVLNTASQGGGIWIDGGTANIFNSTFSGNIASQNGGGLGNNFGTTTVGDCTFTLNQAGSSGGGVFAANGSVTMANSIVAGNTATLEKDVYAFDPSASSSYNLIGTDDTTSSFVTNGVNGNQVGTTASPIDAKLGSLANNGGPTLTHLLTNGSPAINAGGSVTASQHLLVTGNAGTFVLGFNSGSTPSLAYNVSAIALQTALNNVPAVGTAGGVTVSGASPFYTISFTNPPNAALFTAAGSGGAVASVIETYDQRGAGFPRVRGPAVDIGSIEALLYVPTITNATTNEDTQTTSGLVITQNTADAGTTTHYQITSTTGGTLYQSDGTTAISNGDFITVAQGAAGLKFTPTANLNSFASTFGFSVQAAVGGTASDLRDTTATASITVNPVADTPSVTGASTLKNTQTTGGLVISRNAADGAETSYFKITNIQNGTLFKNNGSSQINAGDFITFAEGDAGLKFTPALNFTGVASFDVQASESNGNAGLGGSVVTASILVGTLNPTPVQVGTTATANRQSGLFDLTVNVTNTTPFAINGFRLHVNYSAYLAQYPSLRLYNASSPVGSNDVYIDYPYPVAINGTVSVTLSFYTSDRRFPSPFSPVLTVEKLTTSQVPHANNGGVAVSNVKKLTDGTLLLEWNSIATHWYRISYSSDMTNWFDSPVPIQAGSNKMQWIDKGAPFTSISPADPSVTSRFYIVTEIPQP